MEPDVPSGWFRDYFRTVSSSIFFARVVEALISTTAPDNQHVAFRDLKAPRHSVDKLCDHRSHFASQHAFVRSCHAYVAHKRRALR